MYNIFHHFVIFLTEILQINQDIISAPYPLLTITSATTAFLRWGKGRQIDLGSLWCLLLVLMLLLLVLRISLVIVIDEVIFASSSNFRRMLMLVPPPATGQHACATTFLLVTATATSVERIVFVIFPTATTETCIGRVNERLGPYYKGKGPQVVNILFILFIYLFTKLLHVG